MERPIADGRAPDPLASYLNELKGLGRTPFTDRYGDVFLCLNASEMRATPRDETGPVWVATRDGAVWDDGRRGSGLYALPIRARNHGHDIVVGRDRECDVVLYDQSVSSCHAVFTYDHGRLHLADLGSTHGTFVDGLRVGARRNGGGMELFGRRCPVQFGSLRAVVLRTDGLLEIARMLGLVLDAR